MSPTQKNKIPQPKSIPILGNAHQLKASSPVMSMVEIAKNYDGIFQLNLAGNNMILITNQKLVDEVCDESRFEKGLHPPLRQLRALGGDGLFTAETKELNWEKSHRILMPVFGPVAVRSTFGAMTDIAEQMFTKWERLGDGSVIDVADNMTRLTLDTISLALFSYRFNSFYQTEMHPFVSAMVNGLDEAGSRSRRPGLVNDVLLRKKNQFAEDVRYMHEVADFLVAERKRKGVKTENRDLLDVMLGTKDPVTGEMLDDETIRYQMVTFLIAGHETTSGLLSFVMYELLKNPDVLKKVKAEVDSVLGERKPRVEDIPKLVYIDQVLKETLRLWPTAPAFAIRCLEDETTLSGKYVIKKDDVLLVLLPTLHRDPDIWTEPEKFDPDRMSTDKFEKLPPNSWKPFGNGARGCIGRAFAMQEATLVIAMAIQRFEFEHANSNYKLEVKETLTLKPDDFKVRITNRHFKLRNDDAFSSRPLASADKKPIQELNEEARTPLLLLYGSNSGSSESFARKIGSDAKKQGYQPTIATLDEYVGKLPIEGAVVIITASYEGQPPDNARKFVDWISSISLNSLSNVNYAIFGCGNRDWSRTYQAIPKRIEEALSKAGAKKLIDRGEADAKGDFFGDFENWYSTFWEKLGANFGHRVHADPAPVTSLVVEFVEKPREGVLRSHSLQMGTVLRVQHLVDVSKPRARPKVHIELELPSGLDYRSGDYLSVLGSNPEENVKRVLKRFNIDPEEQIVLHAPSDFQSPLPTERPISVLELISNYVELAQPATKRQIQQLADACPCPPEKMALIRYIQTEDEYTKSILEKRRSPLDLLELYQSCNLTFSSFLQMLPPLKPRQYSISSSPLRDPRLCTLTVAVVRAEAFSGSGNFIGVTSNFLARLKPGDKIPIAPKASQNGFHLPDNPKLPIIMVCAGTGIAPFRGFLEERALLKKNGTEVGQALLFFGCDHPDIDFLYREELYEYEKLGVVTVRPAFSSLPEGDVMYVQHRVWESRADVVEFLKRGAKAYVCGDGKFMAPAVRQAFAESYKEVMRASTKETESWLEELEQNTRYVEDVFS